MGLVFTHFAMSSLLPPSCTPHSHACTSSTTQMLPHVGISCHWASLTGNQSALQLHARIQQLSTGKGIISVEPRQTDFLVLVPSLYQVRCIPTIYTAFMCYVRYCKWARDGLVCRRICTVYMQMPSTQCRELKHSAPWVRYPQGVLK